MRTSFDHRGTERPNLDTNVIKIDGSVYLKKLTEVVAKIISCDDQSWLNMHVYCKLGLNEGRSLGAGAKSLVKTLFS